MEARGMGIEARGMWIAPTDKRLLVQIFEIGWLEELLYKTLR